MNFGPGSEKDGQVFYFMIYNNVLQRRKIFILYGRHQYRHWNDWIRKKSAPGAEEKLGKKSGKCGWERGFETPIQTILGPLRYGSEARGFVRVLCRRWLGPINLFQTFSYGKLLFYCRWQFVDTPKHYHARSFEVRLDSVHACHAIADGVRTHHVCHRTRLLGL